MKEHWFKNISVRVSQGREKLISNNKVTGGLKHNCFLFLVCLFVQFSDLYFSFSFLVEMAKRVAGKLYLSVFVLFRDFFFINFIRLSYHKITSMQNNNNK